MERTVKAIPFHEAVYAIREYMKECQVNGESKIRKEQEAVKKYTTWCKLSFPENFEQKEAA